MKYFQILRIIFCVGWISIAAAHEGHQPSSFSSLDISGTQCCRELRLADEKGQTRTLSDFRGKIVVLTFGYTHCGDVCPITLSNLASVRRELGAKGKDMQVLFVTLDPNRDTAPILRQYLDGFDPSFVGLRGDEQEMSKVEKDFRVIVDRDPASADGQYSIYHLSGTVIFDKSGKPRLYVAAERPELLVKDIKLLLQNVNAAQR